MRRKLVTARVELLDDIRVAFARHGVRGDRDLEIVAVQCIEHAEHGDARAILVPAVLADVRIRAPVKARIADRAGRGLELEMLEIEHDVGGDARIAWPREARACDSGG